MGYMEEREKLQQDALKDLVKYSDSLIPALQELIDELRLENKADTKQFLNEVITGINWEIEIYNQCASLINANSNYVDKKTMVSAVKNLGITLNSCDNWQIAGCLEKDFLPFLNKLDLAAKRVLNN